MTPRPDHNGPAGHAATPASLDELPAAAADISWREAVTAAEAGPA